MSAKKCHRDQSPCPLEGALDIIGDHWTLLVIRDLMFMGRHEYKELLGAWEGISTNILSDRLSKLQKSEIIDSCSHPESKRRKLYYLTEKGKSLFPIIAEMTIWGFSQQNKSRIPPHLKELLTGSSAKVEKHVRKTLNEWETLYLGEPIS